MASTYTIRRGDCLSVIAQRFHTTVADLMKANPQIKDANLIYTGNRLSIPDGYSGGKSPKSVWDGYNHGGGSHSGGGSHAGGATGTGGTAAPVPGGHGHGTQAYNAATSVLGRNISDLKYNGPLAQYLDKWPGNNVCCANFVSSCLEKAGLISHSEHNDSVAGLASNLRRDPNWHQTSLKDAKPGDVVCFNVPGEGPYSHVVMFAGWKNGVPQFIGSNNVNSDGSQRITQSSMGYPIAAIFEHN